jgi:hypothetical protein
MNESTEIHEMRSSQWPCSRQTTRNPASASRLTAANQAASAAEALLDTIR